MGLRQVRRMFGKMSRKKVRVASRIGRRWEWKTPVIQRVVRRKKIPNIYLTNVGFWEVQGSLMCLLLAQSSWCDFSGTIS